ncbi:DnaJ and RRM 1 and Cornichon domain containing pr otein [Trichuris trichiura]|uniref:DnaJ and RRM 1 and Cornichon domain containing pr otein n=1 Tax=Trichuris trichiura TaxID=36087 RepID=A0A077YWD5_TRITR|nr:DnaJ and RRM 1 and Cornichon domain containing pr otein [Trichuris trichiura]
MAFNFVAVTYIFALIITAFLLFFAIYHIIAFEELKTDYRNPIEQCNSLNPLIIPEYGMHLFFNVLFLFSMEFFSLAINVPLLAYHIHKYINRPVMSSPGIYDPTTIMNADHLNRAIREGWAKLLFYIISFFYYLYCMISTLVASIMDAKTLDFDPYELLDLTDGCTEQDVVKAYRKKALKWHPDKNADQKLLAQEMFLKVARALEILGDKAAREAYDRLRKAKKAAEERYRHLDAKRRKLKEELEAREAKVQNERQDEISAAKRFAAEIERLRAEGSKLLQREKENVEKQVKEEARKQGKPQSSLRNVVKVQWDPDAASVSADFLRFTFEQFGETLTILPSSSKKGTAVIEFRDFRSATAAKSAADERRIPFSVELLGVDNCKGLSKPVSRTMQSTSRSPSETHLEFEAAILARMREAEERKQLFHSTMDRQDEG